MFWGLVSWEGFGDGLQVSPLAQVELSRALMLTDISAKGGNFLERHFLASVSSRCSE